MRFGAASPSYNNRTRRFGAASPSYKPPTIIAPVGSAFSREQNTSYSGLQALAANNLLHNYNNAINPQAKTTKHLPLKANFWHTVITFLVNKCKFAL